jgi:transposase InsO family protein
MHLLFGVEHSRRALGWAVADHMRTEVVLHAVDRAVFVRGGRCRGTILHSDRGQYTAGDMAAARTRQGLRRSMERPGTTLARSHCGRRPNMNATTAILTPPKPNSLQELTIR